MLPSCSGFPRACVCVVHVRDACVVRPSAAPQPASAPLTRRANSSLCPTGAGAAARGQPAGLGRVVVLGRRRRTCVDQRGESRAHAPHVLAQSPRACVGRVPADTCTHVRASMGLVHWLCGRTCMRSRADAAGMQSLQHASLTITPAPWRGYARRATTPFWLLCWASAPTRAPPPSAT